MNREAVNKRAESEPVAQPETRELNFYLADASLRGVLGLYLDAATRAALEPHLERLGGLVGARLDDLARAADLNPSVLHHRDRTGADRQRIEKHPAYEEMERLAFGDFALTVMSHRAALGRNAPWPSLAKYALTYLFVQSEFGLMCPVNMTDSLTRTIRRYAAPELLGRYLPRLLADEPEAMFQGAMFMTERFAGSDVGATVTRAVPEGQNWRLWGDKWFCSNADADLALVLARPEGAGAGTRGLGLFLLPRVLENGQPNSYRIVRLKEKLGTRAMPSGEIRLEGAVAWLVGDLGQGFKQMAEMVNQSRLSNGVRAAGLMRRAVHEALAVARGREAFGRRLIELPLMRRQLAKMIVPAEQALAIVGYTADCFDRADAGEAEALRRILTPLVKLRACRDARTVTGDGMEVRGGCGYDEEFIEPRLLRESHLGSIWEGTSNIIALDVIRAARKAQAHEALARALAPLVETAAEDLRAPLAERLERAVAFIGDVAREGPDAEHLARQAATGLYNATTSVLLAAHGAALGEPWRAEAVRLVLLHRLGPADPLAPAVDDGPAVDALLAALAV